MLNELSQPQEVKLRMTPLDEVPGAVTFTEKDSAMGLSGLEEG